MSTLIARLEKKKLSVTVACVVLAYGLLLMRPLGNWRSAGAMTRSIVEEVQAIPPDVDVHLLYLPDNIAGAYVFRNGFNDAEALTTGRERTAVLSTYEVYDAATVPTVTPTDPGVSLELPGPESVFYHPVAGPEGCATVLGEARERRFLDVDLRGCPARTRIDFYPRADAWPRGLGGS